MAIEVHEGATPSFLAMFSRYFIQALFDPDSFSPTRIIAFEEATAVFEVTNFSKVFGFLETDTQKVVVMPGEKKTIRFEDDEELKVSVSMSGNVGKIVNSQKPQLIFDCFRNTGDSD